MTHYVLVCVIATREIIHLYTDVDYSNRWYAIDTNTYDADYDYEAGSHVSKSPEGHGDSQFEAATDLLEQLS